MVSTTQIILLLLSILAYLAGGISALASLMGKKLTLSRGLALSVGLILSGSLLIWHSVTVTVVGHEGSWQPLQDNFSAMLTLAVLLAAFVGYVQIKRPMPSLEWLTMPIVILLLLMAGHFGTTQPNAYARTAYSVAHRLTTYVGAVAFMVAGITGVMYLLSDHSLRGRKSHLPPRPGVFGSLERLERLTYTSVTIGFALFSVGLIVGIAWLRHDGGSERMGPTWYLSPKVVLSVAAWLLFAVVLHTPIAPRLRGRKNAILSIAGMLFTLAAIIAVLLMPAGGAN